MEEREILNKPRRGAGSCEVLCRLGCTHLVFKDQATTKKHLIPFQSRHEVSQFPSIVSLRSYSPGICSRNLADSRIFSLGNFHRFAHLIQILLRRARAYELLGQPEESLGDLRAVWVAQICLQEVGRRINGRHNMTMKESCSGIVGGCPIVGKGHEHENHDAKRCSSRKLRLGGFFLKDLWFQVATFARKDNTGHPQTW